MWSSHEQPADDGFKLKGSAFTFTLFALCLSVFIGGLDGTIVVIAMPVIAAQFSALSLHSNSTLQCSCQSNCWPAEHCHHAELL
jgi:hypothetical protein